MNEFFSFLLISILFIIILIILGSIVTNYAVKINYTRKIVHFSMFILPFIIFDLLNISNNNSKIIISFSSAFALFILISPFFQNKSKLSRLMFLSIDRPEDRPHTYSWLISQTVLGYIILAISFVVFQKFKVSPQLLYLTTLVTTIGDGLAEPIGVKWGTHKYQTKGFFTEKKFSRSIEGSLTIFFTSVLLIFILKQSFTVSQFYVLMVLYPLIVTFVEAKSPHTWDTPFLFLSGNLCTLLIMINI